ncbi:MAG: hypothetical protein P4L48_18360 [Mycobacterium sp.]|uniref:hypothetical protein n=1 Tax=Mycobacterium sp. TaxID=1785 RepID=UPI00284E0F8E|nr:hypothetical protein [Mycobacterium sp.]HKI39869.1 hypothetical protein [Mycobacterium sp.]
MKTKPETPNRRRGRRDGAARNADPASSRRSRTARAAAPTREARTPGSGPQTSPITRPVERPARPKSTSQAKARAKARKAKAPKAIRLRLTERVAARLASIDLRPRTLASKVPFVVLVIGALGLGLGLTLWLSTDSAERSYKLSHAREKNRLLQEEKEALERDVREAESAPALAEAARKQGMIPTRDTAHLVQDPSGNWVVVGTPKPADGVPPPPLNSKLPEPGPPAPPKLPALPPEVPVRLEPASGGAPAPARLGPEALLRAPDGSSTIGGQHLPQTLPQLPGVPNGPLAGQVPAVAPLPGLPTPVGPAPAPGPAEVRIPLGGLPATVPVPAPLPAEVPVPVRPGPAPQGVVPVAPGPAVPQPGAPVTGEQFGPLTAASPGAPQ